jgi:hypothetical protein
MNFGTYLLLFFCLTGPYWHVFEKWFESVIKAAVRQAHKKDRFPGAIVKVGRREVYPALCRRVKSLI